MISLRIRNNKIGASFGEYVWEHWELSYFTNHRKNHGYNWYHGSYHSNYSRKLALKGKIHYDSNDL